MEILKYLKWDPKYTPDSYDLHIRPVLIGNLFQLYEDSHDRRGRAASHYHYLIIYDI